MKNAILQTADQTFSRKFQELFLAIKLDNNYSKDQILENYLNTIYYGRGAYGIESAAKTYFGVDASALTAQQGAVLAVLDPQPLRLRPGETTPRARRTAGAWCSTAMVEQGWLELRGPRGLDLPRGAAGARPSNLGYPDGPEGLIVRQVLAELQDEHGLDDQDRSSPVACGSPRTVDKAYQDAAAAAVDDVMEGEPEGLRQALVAVDPRTGAVLAYYGGRRAAPAPTTPRPSGSPARR